MNTYKLTYHDVQEDTQSALTTHAWFYTWINTHNMQYPISEILIQKNTDEIVWTPHAIPVM